MVLYTLTLGLCLWSNSDGIRVHVLLLIQRKCMWFVSCGFRIATANIVLAVLANNCILKSQLYKWFVCCQEACMHVSGIESHTWCMDDEETKAQYLASKRHIIMVIFKPPLPTFFYPFLFKLWLSSLISCKLLKRWLIRVLSMCSQSNVFSFTLSYFQKTHASSL
jgi:hypothetical protein